MAYSNRPSKRPDPTVAPVVWDPLRKEYRTRYPFEPSAHKERSDADRATKKKINKLGHLYHGACGSIEYVVRDLGFEPVK